MVGASYKNTLFALGVCTHILHLILISSLYLLFPVTFSDYVSLVLISTIEYFPDRNVCVSNGSLSFLSGVMLLWTK